MSLTILADSNIPAVMDCFSPLGEVRTTNGRDLCVQQLADVDILLVRSVTQVDEALLRDSPVKFVGSATSGLDHIDQNFLSGSNIGFAHAPGANANSVVEYVLAAMCTTQDKLEQLLAGATVGIVGYGNVGQALATRLAALDINFRVYDPWLDQAKIPAGSSLEAVLASEVVTVHCELTAEQPWPSEHLLGATALQQLQPSALFINASRGAVVDNAALLQHLTRNSELNTVLDVWEGEPSINLELLNKVSLGTPHIAGYSLDAKLLATRMLRDALTSYFELAPGLAANPAADAPELSLSSLLTGAPLIRQLIQARYDITADDARLRVATVNDKAKAADNFDALRKDYPPRRELLGSIVQCASATTETSNILEALGCRAGNEVHAG